MLIARRLGGSCPPTRRLQNVMGVVIERSAMPRSLINLSRGRASTQHDCVIQRLPAYGLKIWLAPRSSISLTVEMPAASQRRKSGHECHRTALSGNMNRNTKTLAPFSKA